MRWPFRRRGGDAPAAADTTAKTPAPRPPARHWVTVPPLPTTITRTAPLVAGPAPVVPPLPGRRAVSDVDIPPPAGRVTGLASVPPRQPEPPMAERPAPMGPERPLVHRRVRSGLPVRRATMVEAAGGFVGEPREPAQPHRAPGWMRYVPEWLTQSTQAADPPPSVPSPPVPAAPAPERKLVEPTRPATMDTERPAGPPKRRPSLGQSRRLGLGAPLKHRPDEQAAAQEDPAPVPEEPEAADEDSEPPPPPPEPPPQPRPPAAHHPQASELRPAGPVREVTPTEHPPAVPGTSTSRSPAGGVPLTYRAAPGPVTPRPPTDRATPARPTPRPPTHPARPGIATPSPPIHAAAPGTAIPRPPGDTGWSHPTPATPRPAPVAVPTELASALRGAHQVDLTTVPVHRGPEVSATARALGARAFARGGEVYLPDDAGPLDAPKARGLLAHELVHAVQQRTLGPSPPTMSTVAGAALEAEAVAAEHRHSGHGPEATLVHPALPRVLSQAAQAVGVQLAPLVPEPASAVPAPAAPAPEPPTAPVQTAKTSANRVLEEWTNPALGGTGFARPPTPGAARLPSAGLPDGRGTDTEHLVRQLLAMSQSTTGLPAGPSGGLAGLFAFVSSVLAGGLDAVTNDVPNVVARQLGHILGPGAAQAPGQGSLGDRLGFLLAAGDAPRVPARPAEPPPAAPAQPEYAGMTDDQGKNLSLGEAMANSFVPGLFDSTPPEPEAGQSTEDDENDDIDLDKIDLDELTARLYDRLRSRLRLELLIDRERAGLLTDFR